MTQGTAALGPDGRSLIEVTTATITGARDVALEGTATVFEGTVLLAFLSDDEVVARAWVQASAGGPERGSWRYDGKAPPQCNAVELAPTEMSEGALTAHLRRLRLPLNPDAHA